MSKVVKIIHQDCDPGLAKDKSLPTTAYLVEYIQGETSHWDIVICVKTVDLFDEYWDKYKKNLIGFVQAEGRMNPKLWSPKKDG